jgi:hypothetical protein
MEEIEDKLCEMLNIEENIYELGDVKEKLYLIYEEDKGLIMFVAYANSYVYSVNIIAKVNMK